MWLAERSSNADVGFFVTAFQVHSEKFAEPSLCARSPVARQVAERAEAPAPAEAAEEEVDFEADEPEEVRHHSVSRCTSTGGRAGPRGGYRE